MILAGLGLAWTVAEGRWLKYLFAMVPLKARRESSPRQ